MVDKNGTKMEDDESKVFCLSKKNAQMGMDFLRSPKTPVHGVVH